MGCGEVSEKKNSNAMVAERSGKPRRMDTENATKTQRLTTTTSKVSGQEKAKGIVPKTTLSLGKLVNENKEHIADRYTREEVLDGNSFSQIEIFRDKLTGSLRAMKVIPKAHCEPDEASFPIVIDTLKSLDHPNVARVFELTQDEDKYYLVTEYCSGGPLFEGLLGIKGYTEVKVASVMKQLLSAVAYCHAKKLAHRDIRPENVLFTTKDENSQIKVINFGVASAFNYKSGLHKKIIPYYTAPEALQNAVLKKSDVWSCGVIMYILLSGVPPFTGSDNATIAEKITTGQYSFSGSVWESVSMGAKRLLSQMLVVDSTKRISAHVALKDEWLNSYINNEEKKEEKSMLALQNLKKFRAKSQMQQAVLLYLANHTQTEQKMNRLRKIFQSFDKNGDGVLERKELEEGYMKLGKSYKQAMKIVDSILKNVDVNNSGSIDYAEFLMVNMKEDEALSKEKLKEVFKLFDKSGDGKISVHEIKEVLGGEDENLKQIVKGMDTDEDGEISFEEFYKVTMDLFSKH